MQKVALRVAAVIFLAVSIIHFVRVFGSVSIYIGQTSIPFYVSWVGGGVSFLLSAWMFVASRK